MLTLTYPGHLCKETGADLGYAWMRDGRLVKDHLRRFRQALTRRGFFGLWFLEFQSRGAPHIHWLISEGLTQGQEQSLRLLWWEIVASGDRYHLEHGLDYDPLRKKEAAGVYAAKYSAKDEQKTVPEGFKDVGRFWGTFGKLPESFEISQGEIAPVDFVQLVRVVRKAEHANRRAAGVGKRHYQGAGIVGFTSFDVAPAIFQYLARIGAVPDSRGRWLLISRRLHSS